MDKNFIFAILFSTLIIISFTSPQYQKLFGSPEPVKTSTEQQTAMPDSGKRASIAPKIPAQQTEPRATEAIQPQTAPIDSTSALPGTAYEQIDVPATTQPVTLSNDNITVTIDPRGGGITESVLTKIKGPDRENPVQIVTPGESWCDGAIVDGDTTVDFGDLVFTMDHISGQMVTFTASFAGGMTIMRTYSLAESGYVLTVGTELTGWNDPSVNYSWHSPINDTEVSFNALRIWPFSMFIRDEDYMYTKIVYLGQGDRTTVQNNGKVKESRIYSKEGSQKLEGKKRGEESDSFVGDLDWYAIRNKYFIAAAIPVDRMRWYTESVISSTGEKKWLDFTIAKRVSDGSPDLELYLGPMQYSLLKEIGHDLTQSMELSFKFIRPLSIAFLWVIKKIHTVIPNWGLVIIVFAFFIKIILYPLSKSSFVSMRKMSAIQPQVAALREKHKSNPQKLNQATMELYRQEGVNPFSSCLPLLMQMPVFFALYPVVGRAFELRQAMFVPHWIEDLSRPDPLYILPIAMGISMFFQSKTTMTDPNQKAMLYVMPVMMVILFANFSSGLTLYWFLFNIMSYAQQKIHR